MLSKTRIIVLHTVKHSDSGMVVQCYSDTLGRSACYFFASSKHSRSAMMFPLSILDVVLFSRHQAGSMPVIKEAVQVSASSGIKSDVRKGAIALFVSELLLKTVKETGPDPSMFSFLSNSVLLLDAMDEGVENFHLHFAVNLCKVLGYMPDDNYSETTPHFNFASGSFTADYTESLCFRPEESELLHQILSTPLTLLPQIKCSGQMRNRFLSKIIEYLSFHVSIRTELKSLSVLRELFA